MHVHEKMHMSIASVVNQSFHQTPFRQVQSPLAPLLQSSTPSTRKESDRRQSTERTPHVGMTTGLLDDADALTLILLQLPVHDGDPVRSLEALKDFGAVSRFAFTHLRAASAHLAQGLLCVDVCMSASDLDTMIRKMSPTHRAKLVYLTQQWNTPHAIGMYYFVQCLELALPKLSSSLTAIGDAAFCECTSLRLVEWDAPLLTRVCNRAFHRCANMTLHSWHVPNLEAVENGAFDGCRALVLSKWDAAVLTSLGDYVFYGCVNLTLHTWHAPKLTYVGRGVFMTCTALVLSKWDAPRLTTIKRNTFKDCTKLTLKEWNAPKLRSIGKQAFKGCSALEWQHGCPFPANVVIQSGAFRGCTNLSALARSQIAAINANALDPV